MTTHRKCRYVPLSKQPLVLVLGQVRFSPVRKLASYIPAIQEEFRRHGFPLEREGKVQQLTITPTGVQVIEQERWEYRTRDERWSITVLHDSVILQTTAYERFEGFAAPLEQAVRTVLEKTEQSQFGLVERIGLRYVDLIRPRAGEDYREYLRPGFHGVADEAFRARSHRLHVESIGHTAVGDIEGTMIIRVVQNDQGFDLPPDLLGGAPQRELQTRPGDLITLLDMDHFVQGKFDADPGWVITRAYELHDHLVETFHTHVVTEKAIEVWL